MKIVDVSCIIINYNTAKYTIDCINSIVSNTEETFSYEILVIDNASTETDYRELNNFIIEKNNKRVKLIRSKQNVGFGAGNMIGVQNCSPCKYYAFINNDTLQVSNNCLQHLKNFMDTTPDAGVCSPQMLDEHKNFRVTIDHFSTLQREIFRRAFLEFLFPKTYLKRKKTYQNPTKVHYVQGSFMFVDAVSFNNVGGFDTNLFLYYEESDISLRLLKMKKKYTYLIPSLEYIHYKSKSINRNIDIKIEQKISLLYYINKHHGWFHHKILLVYYSIRYFFTSIVKPKYWKLFLTFLVGAPLSKSIKFNQPIIEFENANRNKQYA
ncbi:glycosyltransferase family 2 protein [Flavobacteriaceae bacterium XHP0103]|uniref:glycosyltransferase family 2 protein n=1 Tax=Marixanthotalea marina TaxID=2844359 RepID=UPI002989BD65|nr:glycosyltransferase family 2 protein [Marixanthotalea marina]MBU3822410.1 glycosyltransferase family 2 protein [Marixanthotalea marina]